MIMNRSKLIRIVALAFHARSTKHMTDYGTWIMDHKWTKIDQTPSFPCLIKHVWGRWAGEVSKLI